MWIGCNVFVLVSDVNSGDHDLAWDYRMLARQLVLRDKAPALGLVGARLAILQKLGYYSRTYLLWLDLDWFTRLLRLQLNNMRIWTNENTYTT